jgi:hypothetical protein
MCAFSTLSAESLKEEKSIHWVSNSQVLYGNKHIFSKYAEILGLTFEDVEEVILDKKNLMLDLDGYREEDIRDYNHKEIVALMAYAASYSELTQMAAKEIDEVLDTPLAWGIDGYDIFKAFVGGLLVEMFTGNIRAGIAIAIYDAFADFISQSIVNPWKPQEDTLDCLKLYSKRVERARQCVDRGTRLK